MSRSRLSARVWTAGRCFLVPEVSEGGEEFLLRVRADGQVPVLGGLPVPDVADVGVLGGAGGALAGERGMTEDAADCVVPVLAAGRARASGG